MNTETWLLGAASGAWLAGFTPQEKRSRSALPLPTPGPLHSSWLDAWLLGTLGAQTSGAHSGTRCPSADELALYPLTGLRTNALGVLCTAWGSGLLAQWGVIAPRREYRRDSGSWEGGCACWRNRRAWPLARDAWARGARAGSCSSCTSPISFELPLPTQPLWVPGIPVCKRRGNLSVQRQPGLRWRLGLTMTQTQEDCSGKG